MSFFKNLFKTPSPNKINSPLTVQLGDKGLKAHIYLHDIMYASQQIPCWSYVTEGLIQYGQKELVFTLQRLAHEAPTAYLDEPLQVFIFISELAEQGNLVEAGGFTHFGTRNFLGRHLVYVPAQASSDLSIPKAALHAILITEEELIAGKEFGFTRLMARLGYASQYFPFPFWSDRHRLGLSFAAIRQQSILTKLARIHVFGLSVLYEINRVVIRARPMVAKSLPSELVKLPENMSLACLTTLDSEADGCLVWEPKQSGPTAITHPNSTGSRLSGCFVVFVPGQVQDEVRLTEDGVALLLTNPSWEHLKTGLLQTQNVHLPVTQNGTQIQLEWITGE